MKAQKPQKNEERRIRPRQALPEQDGEQKSCASDAQADSDSSCSSHGFRKISHEDIELAQNLIERCLQLYMTQDEVAAILVNRAKLEPGFTKLVWQKLEEENVEFFKAYYARLKLKKQITTFNLLLERQHHLMNSRPAHNVMPHYMHNGFQHIPGGAVNPSMGYLPPPIPFIPSNAHTHMESSHYDVSSQMVVDGIPALGSFYPSPVTAIDTTVGTKQEVAASCPSDSNNKWSLAPEDILPMSVDPMTLNAPFPSNMCGNEDLQLASDDNNENILDNPSYSHLIPDLGNFGDLGALGHNPSSLFSLSDIDTLLNSPDQCDIVDNFIVDADPNCRGLKDEQYSRQGSIYMP